MIVLQRLSGETEAKKRPPLCHVTDTLFAAPLAVENRPARSRVALATTFPFAALLFPKSQAAVRHRRPAEAQAPPGLRGGDGG